MINPNDIINEHYRLIELVGEGSFGEVWRCEDLTDGGEKAVKICVSLDKSGQEEFLKEHELSSSLAHPNILSTEDYGVWEKHPYIVMQYMAKGSATGYVGTLSPCEKDEKIIWQFIYDVASGLEYLHGFSPNPIVHQDIKPANILINANGHFVISDFGISKQLRDTMRTQSKRGNTAGAAAYMAPERFAPHPPTIMASDIWSLGASIYELAEGVLPFSGLGGCVQGSGVKLPPMSKGWSKELKKVQRSCMELKPYDRKRACDIKEIAYGMLNPEPKEPVKKKLLSWTRKNFKKLKIVSAILLLIFFGLIIILSGKRCSNAKNVDELQFLAELLDSVKPDEVGALAENVLYYKKDSLYFFIDSIGIPIGKGEPFDTFNLMSNVIITERDTFIEDKRNVIKIDKRHITRLYGLITANGNELLPCENIRINHFAGVYAFFKDSLWGCVNDTMQVLELKYKSIDYGGHPGLLLCYNDKEKYVFYTRDGQRKFPSSSDTTFYYAESFNSGYSRVRDYEGGDLHYMDTLGDILYLKNDYDFHGEFKNRMAEVGKKEDFTYKFGLIDENLMEVLPCKYSKIESHKIGNNAVVVRQDSIWKIIDFSQNPIAFLSNHDFYFNRIGIEKFPSYKQHVEIVGNFISIDNKKLFINNHCIPEEFEEIHLNNYFAKCKTESGKYFIYAKSGEKIGPFEYVVFYYDENYYEKAGIKVEKNGYYGLFDINMNQLIECKFNYIDEWSPLGLFAAKENSLWGYIDMQGEWKIPNVYEYASTFINDFAIVKKEGKYGVIDKNNSIAIPFDYDKIGTRKLNLFVVNKNGKYGVAEAQNKNLVVPCEFDNDFKYISNSRFPILKDGKWGFYTNDGRSTLKMSNNSNTKQQ